MTADFHLFDAAECMSDSQYKCCDTGRREKGAAVRRNYVVW